MLAALPISWHSWHTMLQQPAVPYPSVSQAPHLVWSEAAWLPGRGFPGGQQPQGPLLRRQGQTGDPPPLKALTQHPGAKLGSSPAASVPDAARCPGQVAPVAGAGARAGQGSLLLLQQSHAAETRVTPRHHLMGTRTTSSAGPFGAGKQHRTDGHGWTRLPMGNTLQINHHAHTIVVKHLLAQVI